METNHMNTHITFVLDRTGSMSSIKEETISGFNHFITEQQKEKGLASLLLVQFDSLNPFEVVEDFSNISQVKLLDNNTFQPRGFTPLFDAIGHSITHTAYEIGKLRDVESPELVIVAILTDGYENASKEYTKNQIKHMIEEKQSQGWKFVFLGANMDAVDEATSMGISAGTSMTFGANYEGTTNVYAATNTLVSNLRSGNVNYTYTNEDRENALGKENKK